MPADVQSIATQCAGLDAEMVGRFLERFDPDYLARFEPDQVAEHVRGLSQLSADQPVRVLLNDEGEGWASCAVLAFDHAFEFSLITGVLAGMGFRIESGDVFTLPPAEGAALGSASASQGGRPVHRSLWRRRFAQSAARRASRLSAPPLRDPVKQAVILDYFRGQRDGDEPFDAWADRLRARMGEVIGLLDRGDEASVQQAKRRVNEMVTERLARLEMDRSPVMQPIELAIDQVAAGPRQRTRLKIIGQDTPAFLYSLATALSLHGLSIERVRIHSEGTRAEDELHVVDAHGRPITDETALERIRLSVLLTKQFTYFLDNAPDPFTALTRFEQLTEWVSDLPQPTSEGEASARHEWLDALADPAAMQELAKLLGASDFLWEDFIRQQYETLLPIFSPQVEGRRFCDPMETLPLRLEQELESAVGLAEQQDRLNRFKDREIYRIDLDHILTPGSDFRELSERLVALAENLIAVATRLVYDDLVRSYGHPTLEDGQPCPYAVFGLGKLGGVALGYASDIELLYVYAGVGRTSGGKRGRMANPEFYGRLVQETTQSIKARHEGIFQVDLRLRPYGKDGPLACSLDQFRTYYGPHGRAHAFEKMALVRLRWLAGDPPLGFSVERLRDQFIYDQPGAIDLDALWEILAKQRHEKNRPGVLNAKYSPGALTDLEGTVQLLQVTHAGQAPQLRTPRVREALEGLCRARVIAARPFADLYGAYKFLRRLINALRMLRGNAQDLALPAAGSDELTHLARRMGYTGQTDRTPAEKLIDAFNTHTASVRAFIEEHFKRPAPGT
jgi:[glutamine synthetase] adenylyltransferase / [glutamine synthetase]-adenylyl-L-tyrosine phosphorylase